MDRNFLQLVRTTMGTKADPPYANLFMGRHEETIWEAYIWAIPFRNTFIDDVILIFIGTTKQIQSIKQFMNNLYPTIRFTFEQSTQEISQQPCTENPPTVLHFCNSTPTTHLNAKKAVFSLALRYNLFIEMTSKRTRFFYKISPCQKIPFRSQLTTSLKSSSTLITLFSTESQRHQFLDLSSQS